MSEARLVCVEHEQADCESCMDRVETFKYAAPPKNRSGWMQTYSGRQYWPLDPNPTDVVLADVAHHLAMICRFCGACNRHYSVAEHSVYVSLLVPHDIAAHALLHDGAEAYCNDIVRPVKRGMHGYAAIEAANERAVFEAFGLPLPSVDMWAAIKQADNAMLLAEQAVIMAPAPATWDALDVPEELRERALSLLLRAPHPMPPSAKYPFIKRAHELGLR